MATEQEVSMYDCRLSDTGSVVGAISPSKPQHMQTITEGLSRREGPSMDRQEEELAE